MTTITKLKAINESLSSVFVIDKEFFVKNGLVEVPHDYVGAVLSTNLFEHHIEEENLKNKNEKLVVLVESLNEVAKNLKIEEDEEVENLSTKKKIRKTKNNE